MQLWKLSLSDTFHWFCCIMKLWQNKKEGLWSYKKLKLILEAMVSFVLVIDNEAQLRQNAMLLYPYIQDEMISHGKATPIILLLKAGQLKLQYQSLCWKKISYTKMEVSFFVCKIFRKLSLLSDSFWIWGKCLFC